MRITLALIAFVIWCFVSSWWYVCKIKGLCYDNEVKVETTNKSIEEAIPAVEPETGNLVFKWSDSSPLTNAATQATVDSLQGLLADGNQLTVIGLYRPDETNDTGFENLGLARAEKVKDVLISKGLSNITTAARQVGRSGDKTGLFKAVDFDLVASLKSETEVTDFEFTEEDGKITINFPVASADPGLNENLSVELKKIAEHAIEQKQTLVVVGHTDNTGTSVINKKYGQLRADIIRKILIKDGVPSSQVIAKSEGEHEPIASNSTEAGKKKNRRVEITIK